MAKKKAQDVTSPAIEASTRPVKVELTDELHRLFRLIAADQEISMAALARETIERFIRDEAKKRGFK